MNPPDHPSALDLAASAIVDGEASPAELARLDHEVALRERVEEFRGIAAAVAAPVALPGSGRRDAQISAAIAAAVTDVATASSSPPDPPVLLASHRRRVTPTAIAAAVLAALLIPLAAIALSMSGGSSSSDFAAVGSAVAGDEDGGVADATADSSHDQTAFDSQSETASRAQSSAKPTDDLQSEDDLFAAASVALEPLISSTTTAPLPLTGPAGTVAPAPAQIGSAYAVSACDQAALTIGPPGASVVTNFSTTYQGRPVLVVVVAAPDGTRTAIALDPASCAVVAQATL